jgi:hypothetical protein
MSANAISLKNQYQLILDRIHNACLRVQRPTQSVQLIAVSKNHPNSSIAELANLNQLHFGENRVQELLEKKQTLHTNFPALQWHLIGQLQTNKIRKIIPHTCLIHSIDSERLASQIQRISAELQQTTSILLEINLAAEPRKAGIHADNLFSLAKQLLPYSHLNLQGLMCIPPDLDDPQQVRPYFRQLHLLKQQLENELSSPLPLLSMGMSHDFEIAIEEGSTHVRVGTAIFGTRNTPYHDY